MVRKWSEEDIETLKRMHASGASFREIGIELGVSRNACIGKAHRLDLLDIDRPVNLRNGSVKGKKLPKDRQRPRPGRRRLKLLEPRQVTIARHAGGFALDPNKVRPLRKPEPPPPPIPLRGPVAFLDRPLDRCAFIADDPKAQPITKLMCCGEDVMLGESYCPAHFAKTHQRYVLPEEAATFVPARAA